MDTNPQYRSKTDPKSESDVQYNTNVRTGTSTTGWIIGGLIVLALIAAFFMWGGSGTPPQTGTGTTTEQPATPPAEQPATPPATQPQGQQPAPAPEQPAPQQPAPAPQ
jgi:hypothetical protein